MSNASFTIFTGGITVSSPNGGESWQAGTSQNITWADNLTENVIIDLYKGGVFHSVISAPTSSDGTKAWAIPFALESGNDYTVKITSIDNASIFDFSDSNFTIIGNVITVTSPNDGSENYLIGSVQIITWGDNLSGNVEIQLCKIGMMMDFIYGYKRCSICFVKIPLPKYIILFLKRQGKKKLSKNQNILSDF